MKILISAYACEPNKGSEPEVGWQHMIKSAKQKSCSCYKKSQHRKTVKVLDLDNVFFILIYHMFFMQKINRIYCCMLIFGKYFFFCQENIKKFDLVQRVTFVFINTSLFGILVKIY